MESPAVTAASAASAETATAPPAPDVEPQPPGTGWAALEHALREEPQTFGFFQAVRLLERLRPGRTRVGDAGEPDDDLVRFTVPTFLAFPASEVHGLELPEDEPARMTVNFMGLTGPQGVLPHEYTLLAAERQRSRDDALVDFLDLFHNRIVALFYRAWRRNRLAIAHESEQDDRITGHVLDLAGAGPAEIRARLPVPASLVAFYSGLFARQQRSAVVLEQLIEDYFAVPAEVRQFVGGWYALPRREQCALGEPTPGSRLGLGALAGDEIWDQQARVRIRLGPMSRERYGEFLPGCRGHDALRQITRFFSEDLFEFEVQLVLESEEVPGLVLGGADPHAQPLGWSTWIRTGEFQRDADETILRL